ncbi:hypothetical protein BAE44_0006558 [Dichanthelium oligosanthes]|uniref:EF-hand domain-containing protein n=1 Tax=Dichanthelium oligosanthes TaxID=888268 RepID=A0A1E5W4T4_9POAL|nr:hypothetical protein BAE44_0006558 [Dichanthelium oligosanthes]
MYKAYEPPSNSSGYRKDKVRRKKLTAQKRKEIKEAFDLFDIDGSGIVYTKSLVAGLVHGAVSYFCLSPASIQAPSMQGSSTLR